MPPSSPPLSPPITFIALDQPNFSSKWSIHSLPGFLVPFCHLRMSDTLLGCSVSPAPGLYQVRSDTQSCSEMLCKIKFQEYVIVSLKSQTPVYGACYLLSAVKHLLFQAWDAGLGLVLLITCVVTIGTTSTFLSPCYSQDTAVLTSWSSGAEDPPCPPARVGVLQCCWGMARVHTVGLGLQDALHTTPAQECFHRHILLSTFISLNTSQRSKFFWCLGSNPSKCTCHGRPLSMPPVCTTSQCIGSEDSPKIVTYENETC